jgi:hypothetical protein
MIKLAKLSLDLIDDVVESGVLDTEAFPVIYRPTIQSKPDFSKLGSNNTKLLTANSEEYYGHITSSDATACHVALENWDYLIIWSITNQQRRDSSLIRHRLMTRMILLLFTLPVRPKWLLQPKYLDSSTHYIFTDEVSDY